MRPAARAVDQHRTLRLRTGKLTEPGYIGAATVKLYSDIHAHLPVQEQQVHTCGLPGRQYWHASRRFGRPNCKHRAVPCAAGGVLADQVFHWHRFAHHFWTAVVLAVVLAIYILLGFLPYVDNFGHLFGLATGFFLTTCLLRSFQVHATYAVALYHFASHEPS